MATNPPESTELELVIVSPDKVVHEGTATRIIIPGEQQDLAVLPDHTPLYALVAEGEIEITDTKGDVKNIKVDSGILRVKQNKASIILGFKE